MRHMGNMALGYFVGEPFKPVTVRPGVRGMFDLLEMRRRARMIVGTCGNCGTSTPGYAWCSRECSDLWDAANPV